MIMDPRPNVLPASTDDVQWLYAFMFFIFLTSTWMQSSLLQGEGSGFVGTKLLSSLFLVRKPNRSVGDINKPSVVYHQVGTLQSL